MAQKKPTLKSNKPVSILFQPINIDFKALCIAIAKGTGHTILGKFDELSDDGADAVAALGVEGKSPEALLFILLKRSLQFAVASLLEDSREHLPEALAADKLQELLEKNLTKIEIDQRFFDYPQSIPLLKQIVKILCTWLKDSGLSGAVAKTISERLPSFFPYALHQEWQHNGKHYEVIKETLLSPFSQSADREYAWQTYAAHLQQRVDEGIFSEAFSLKQIYIPLNAYCEEKIDRLSDDGKTKCEKQRLVVNLKMELESWLATTNKDDTIRAISGGPGSGKSSFAKMFAADIAANGSIKVLFVPLHLIDPTRDFCDEIGRFVRDEGFLKHNPLDIENRDQNILIILDGLDELANQGKAAASTARDFIRSVSQTVDRRNINGVNLYILFSGREVVMQESESEFRRHRQVFTVLPYVVNNKEHKYDDPSRLLKIDLRQRWWENFGRLTGDNYSGLPREIDRSDLQEVTTQPLLNYLFALSFRRKKIDFASSVTLNEVYRDLVEAVYERGYEQGRRHASVRDLSLEDFFLILEEVGLAAWHGDGRTTTVAEIEQHCRDGGLGSQLEAFQDGAKRGITRLLAAFFFRQHGERPKGDRTFIFTHKSFGEYLAARRIVRAMQDMVEELERREKTGRGKGWSEIDALERWAKWTGPSEISAEIHKFLRSEIALIEPITIKQWQAHFTRLFSYILRHGMPLEKIQFSDFQDSLFNSRNCEETLLVALNSCAIVTNTVSTIQHPTPTTFGGWLKRIQGQRSSPASRAASRSLSWLNLSGIDLYFSDFYGANFIHSDLSGAQCRGAIFEAATLDNANLHNANLSRSDITDATFKCANLSSASLNLAEGCNADFSYADLTNAKLNEATLIGGSFSHAKLQQSSFVYASLQGTDFSSADLSGCYLREANLTDANLSNTNIKQAITKGGPPVHSQRFRKFSRTKNRDIT